MKQISTPLKIRQVLAQALKPIYQWAQKKYPETFKKWTLQAGRLDFSAMLGEFNLLHRFFFRDTLSRVHFEATDLEKIRRAKGKGLVVYMMRNWGPVEYNFFNALFLREELPVATHANLTHMQWWMPLKKLFYKVVARLDFFYTHGSFPEQTNLDPIGHALATGEVPFVFLNLPPVLDEEIFEEDSLILPLIQTAKNLSKDQKLTLIPLHFIYDRRPGKSEKTLIDVLFGEKENPSALRKTVQFFRNYKKRASAQVADPVDLIHFIDQNSKLTEKEQAQKLRSKLHQIFFREQKAITGPKLKSRQKMIDLVLQDSKLRESLHHLADQSKQPLDSLYLKAQEILEKMLADPNYTVIDLWDVTLRWVFKNIYEGLTVDKKGLERVKQIARNNPLILIPSHRSHVDYLLLSYIFYGENLSMPLVAAGDNLSFWPMGYLFKRSGAYFIRRSFAGDELYLQVFKAYAKTLIREGYFQEFFIEGTRSRTGKIERPRTGLLSVFTDCYLEGSSEDLYLVPISINYEKVLEERSYAKEAGGASKQKESTKDLLRVGKYLRYRSGQVYVNFAEPISLKDYLQKENIHANSDSKNKKESISHLAQKIAVAINDVSMLTAPALVATALLSHDKPGISFSLLFEKMDLIHKALELRKIPFSEALQKNYFNALQISLARYESQHCVEKHHDGLEVFYTLDKHRRAELSYYKNNLLGHCVHFSLLALLLNNANAASFSKIEIKKYYNDLKSLYSYEFVQILSFDQAVEEMILLGAISEEDESLKIKSPLTIQTFAGMFTNYLQSYELCLIALQRMRFVKLDEKTLIKRILGLGHELLLKGDITQPEVLSRFHLQNALLALKAKKMIQTHHGEAGKKGGKTYSSVQANLEIEKCLGLLQGNLDLSAGASDSEQQVTTNSKQSLPLAKGG